NESQNTKYGNPSRVSLSANWYKIIFCHFIGLNSERHARQTWVRARELGGDSSNIKPGGAGSDP
ncbi:MAG: hypothetical protein O2995_15400, partial [Proteobacteria bacterium]|nr:hypothetical protein [Pseudomonadota bacterium]